MIILFSLLGASGPILPNTPPSVVADTFTTNINTAVTVNVLTNDVPGSVPIDPATVELANVVNGTAVANASGQVVFTPTTGFTGTARFDYDVADINGLRPSAKARATGTVQAVATPPNDIIQSGTFTANYIVPAGTIVGTLRINQGVGSGTWARNSGSTKLNVNPLTGSQVNVVTVGALAAGDVAAGLTAVFRYSGDPGQVGNVLETVNVTVTNPPPATGVVLTTATPIRIPNTTNSGATVANVRLDPVGSPVLGAFSKVSGFAGYSVNATTGRVTTNKDLAPADNGSARNCVVRYTPTSGTRPPDLTITTEIFTPVVTSGRLDGFCVNFNGSDDAPPQLVKVARLLGFPNDKPQVVLVNSGVHKDFRAWTNFPASLRPPGTNSASDPGADQGLYIKWLLDNGILPVINFPVTVSDKKDSMGNVLERHAGLWSEVNGGDYDAGIDLTGSRLATIANGRLVVVRIGWEMTLAKGQFPWSAMFDSPPYTAMKTAFNRVVSRTAAKFGANPVLFDWCPHKDQKYNPGETYVLNDIFPSLFNGEHVSIDFYDGFSEVSKVNGRTPDISNYQTSFRSKMDRVRNHAVAKSCTFGIDEWGERDGPSVTNKGGSDNPYFIENMYRYCTEEDVRWQIYFRIDRGVAAPRNPGDGPPDDAVHALVHNAAGGPVMGGPWAGTHKNADPTLATTSGRFVGTGQPGATGLSAARFKTLFGQGGSL